MKSNVSITEKQSVRRSIILALVFFITMTAHYLFKAGIGGLMIKTFSASKMPWFDLGDALVTGILVSILFIARSFNIRISTSIKYITIVLIVTLITASCFWSIESHDRILITIIGFAGNILVFIATYGIWMLMVSSAFEKNWLTLSIIGVGAQFGVWVGSTLSQFLVNPVTLVWLPSVIGCLYIFIFIVLLLCIRKFSCGGTEFEVFYKDKRVTSDKSALSFKKLLSGFSPYINVLLLLILIGSIFGRAVNWLIQQEADYKSTIQDATGFLSAFYQSSAIFSLLLQLIITPLALRRVSNKVGLLLQPILAFIIVLLILIKVNISFNVMLLMVFTSLDYTVYNSFKERLWLPVPLINKVYHKAIGTLFIPKIAAVINALGILLLATNSFSVWAAFVTCIAIMWIVIVWRVIQKNKVQEQQVLSDVRNTLDAV